jgi:hypothetical protein
MLIKQIFFLVFLLVVLGCKKRIEVNPCEGLEPPTAEFYFKEVLTDTAFYADTIFRNNYVNFVASKTYQTVQWEIGSDPRDFTSANFNLSFHNILGTLNIHFTGRATPNTQCFPADNGIYTGTKKLTVLEQFEKPFLTISPMVGRYTGAFTNNPNDTFTVSIDYFDSTKYDVTLTGGKNFYWISNMPKGFRDTTSEPARQYPELRYGQRPKMGYKSLQFGHGSSIRSGKGSANLDNDILKVYYYNSLTGRQIFIGKRI